MNYLPRRISCHYQISILRKNIFFVIQSFERCYK
eukprot:UN13002